MDKDMILKIKQYEDLLKDVQMYFYRSVDCRVQTEQHHKEWIEKINKVLYEPPKDI